MLCVVIVPRNAIVAQEREELVAVPLSALHASQRHWTLVFGSNHLTIKAVHCRDVLSQEMLLQTAAIHIFDDGFQKLAEARDNEFQIGRASCRERVSIS